MRAPLYLLLGTVALADPRIRPGPGNGGSCPMGQQLCKGICQEFSNNPDNCGSCGNPCLAGQTCTSGTCTCPIGQGVCNGRCQSFSSDRQNCGSCGNVCSNVLNNCLDGTCSCPSGCVLAGIKCFSLLPRVVYNTNQYILVPANDIISCAAQCSTNPACRVAAFTTSGSPLCFLVTVDVVPEANSDFESAVFCPGSM